MLGLEFDPRECATLREVIAGSPAAESGFQAGDQIESLNGQPLVSVADVQWVLHNLEASGDELNARVLREGRPLDLKIELPAGWKRAGDISWRVSTWGLRRMTTGGLVLINAAEERRAALDIPAGAMALEVKRVGQYGPHAAAKQAGFQQGDVLVEFDGRTDLGSEVELMYHAVNAHKPGQRVPVTVIRNGQKRSLQLPMQQ